MERGIQFFVSPLLGKLSDSYGRKPVLFFSLSLHAAALTVLAVRPCKITIIIYHVIHGFNGTLAIIHAMVTDWSFISTMRQGLLTQQYGKLGLAVGIAMVLGPALGGNLGKDYVQLPIFIALGCIVSCLVVW